VVFAKIKEEAQIDELRKIAQVVEDCLMSEQIISPESKAFNPHMTIAKMSKMKWASKKGE